MLTLKYVDGSETDVKQHQNLVDLRNRGGMWKVNSNVVSISSIAECCFESFTNSFV